MPKQVRAKVVRTVLEEVTGYKFDELSDGAQMNAIQKEEQRMRDQEEWPWVSTIREELEPIGIDFDVAAIQPYLEPVGLKLTKPVLQVAKNILEEFNDSFELFAIAQGIVDAHEVFGNEPLLEKNFTDREGIKTFVEPVKGMFKNEMNVLIENIPHRLSSDWDTLYDINGDTIEVEV